VGTEAAAAAAAAQGKAHLVGPRVAGEGKVEAMAAAGKRVAAARAMGT